MKEKILFIASLIGVFSPTILLFITNILIIAGVDTTGYADILNIVSIVLTAIILIVAVIFLNKYKHLQNKQVIAQNGVVTTALDANANLMQTLLPNLANQILMASEERSAKLLATTELKINTMMNEMLPELATQTMDVVTKHSQNIVEETTAKANETMLRMDELIPTYSKTISDNVAQTVRENNAHNYKLMTELKTIVTTLQATTSTKQAAILEPVAPDTTFITDSMQANFDRLEEILDARLAAYIANSLEAMKPVVEVVEEPVVEVVEEPVVEVVEEPVVEVVEEPVVEVVEEPVVEVVEEPVVEAVEEPVVEAVEEPVVEAVEEPITQLTIDDLIEDEPITELTQNDEIEDKSDESNSL